MAQTEALTLALKQSLKEQGQTYADLAAGINLSEASIKRLFSEQSFSLKRLDEICDWLNIEISDLVRKAEANLDTISELTREQEKEFAADTKLLMVATLVTNHWQFVEILEHFTLEETELIRLLAKLDKLHMIQLLPGNRVKLLTAKNFSWRKDGPVQNFFYKNVQTEFFKSKFDKPDEYMRFMVGMLSAESKQRFQKSLNKLTREFEELSREDAKLPLDERTGVSLVLASKPWDLPIFDPYRKDL
jgi:DNA-binding Xre family transcriptional regulator